MSVVLILAGAAVALALAMAGAWALVIRTGSSGWADTIWSLSIGVVGVAVVLLPLGPDEPSARAWLVAGLVAIWSLRLGIHIGRRTLKGGDDPRYAQLKREWGSNYPRKLLMFLEIQAGAAFVLVAALLAAAHNPAPRGLLDMIGVLIALVAIGGEAVADAQLTAFKGNPVNKGKVCDVGLWRLSRHPNYFFEWLHWVAYVAIGVSFGGYWWGFATLLAPAMMYWLLAHVSGVPPLEAHMQRSRGEAFREHQRRVRAFWPVPKRSQR